MNQEAGINKQYREATQDNFVNTANIIKDDLLRRMIKQAQDSENMVRSMKMGEQIKFIHDFSGADQFSPTQNSYHQTMAAVVGFGVTRTKLTVTFAQHIAGLTKMQVNLFLVDGLVEVEKNTETVT